MKKDEGERRENMGEGGWGVNFIIFFYILYNVQVMKKLGSAGLLGVNKPVEYGGYC